MVYYIGSTMVVSFSGGIILPSGSIKVGPTISGEPELPNLEAHYDAQNSASVILSGSDVTQWNDISGNGRNQTNSGGTSTTLETGIANGHDCIRFTGSAFIGASWAGGDCTVTVVLKYDAALLAIQQFSIAIGFGAGNKLNIGQWDQVNKPTFGFNSFGGDAFGSNDGKEVLTANYTIVTIYCDHQNITSGMRLFFNETEKSVLQVAGSTSNTLTVNGTFDVGDVDSVRQRRAEVHRVDSV